MLHVANPALPRPLSGLAASAPGQPLANAIPADEIRSQMPPIAQVAARPETRLGREDSSRPIRDALQVGQRPGQRRAAASADKAPQDRAIFRAKVIRFLAVQHQDDQSFLRALKQGTIVIHAVEDQPRPELRPELAFERYRMSVQRNMQADRPVQATGPVTVGAHDFIAWWPNRN